MLIAAAALILPTVLYSTFPITHEIDIKDKILSFSRATAGVLLGIYVFYLYFQLWTHPHVFLDEKSDVDRDACGGDTIQGVQRQEEEDDNEEDNNEEDDNEEVEEHEASTSVNDEHDEDDTPSIRQVYVAAAVLVISAATITGCTHIFIENIDRMTESLHIRESFVAIILIPLASNAPELFQVVAAAREKKVSFAIGVIIGSILQVALFVLPALVIIGWFMGRAMDLYFEISQTCFLFLAVMVVNQVLQDGQCTYLHGIMLLSM
jgi:Ca2+:H+ antiporter